MEGIFLLKKSDQMVVELREQMRGGQGTIEIKNIFQVEELKGKVRLFAEITLPSGASIGFHHHEQEEEVYYFLSGVGIVDDNGITREVKAGEVLLTGDGAGHAVRNTGTELLKILAVILLY